MKLFPLEGPIDLTESKNISTLNIANPLIIKRGQIFQFHRMFMGAEQFRLKRNNIQTIAGRSFTLLQNKFEKSLIKVVHYLQHNFYTVEEARKESKKLFYAYYKQAYFLGVKASGAGISQSYAQLLFKDSSAPNIQAEELRWSQTAATAEMKFWNKFLGDINMGKAFRMAMEKRIKMYKSSLGGHYDAGRVAGSPNTSIVYWLMDKKTHVPCPECSYLASVSPWPKDTLPTTPRAGLCSCLSNCRCSLKITPTTDLEYKQVKAKQPTRAQALRHIKKSKAL